MDIAKRLLDYGFHAPTVYFPLIVKEAVMIEPTETENKATLDAFAEALFRITEEPPETSARGPAHHAGQPSRRSAGGAATGAGVEGIRRKEEGSRRRMKMQGEGGGRKAEGGTATIPPRIFRAPNP